MATSYNVDIVFKSIGTGKIDEAANSIRKLDGVTKDANGRLRDANGRFVAAGQGAAGAANGVGLLGQAFNAALGPLGAALAAVAGLTKAFQVLSEQNFAEAKVRTLGVNSQELTQNLRSLSKELGGQASVAELTGAAYDVASAGFNNAADATKVLKAASLAATGGFSDLNTTGNALTSVLNAYGLSADKAGEITDQFIQTQNDGKIVVAEYAANIGKVASAAASLGIPLAEVNAAIAQSTAAGVQAEVAFTGLKSAFARLASGEAADALKGTGVSIDAASLSANGLVGTLQQLVDAGLDTGQIFKALGTEAAPALLPLLNNLQKTKELVDNQVNSAGAAKAAQVEAANTIQGAWKSVTTAFENLFAGQSALGQAIAGVLQAVSIKLNEIAQAVEIALAPFNFLVGVITTLAGKAGELAAAFRQVLAESEFVQALALIWERVQGVISNIAEKVAPVLGKAFNDVLFVVKQVAGFLGEKLFQALDNIIKLIVGIGQNIPFLAEGSRRLGQEWEEIKQQVKNAGKETEEVAQKNKVVQSTLEQTKLTAEQLVALSQSQGNLTQQLLSNEIAIAEAAGNTAKAVQLKLKATQEAATASQAELNAKLEAGKITSEQFAIESQLIQAKKEGAQFSIKQAESERLLTEEKKKQQEAQKNIAVATDNTTEVVKKQLQAQLDVVQALGQTAELSAQNADTETRKAVATLQGLAAKREQVDLEFKLAIAGRETEAAFVAAAEALRQAKLEAIGINEQLQQALLTAERLKSVGIANGPIDSFGEAGKNSAFVQEFRKAVDALKDSRGNIAGGDRAYYEVFNRFLQRAEQFNQNKAAEKNANARAELDKYSGNSSAAFTPSPINITTGPVVQMDGTTFVKQDDFTKGVKDASSQATQNTLKLLERDPDVRRKVGLAQ